MPLAALEAAATRGVDRLDAEPDRSIKAGVREYAVRMLLP
jgi:hypothetical protein